MMKSLYPSVLQQLFSFLLHSTSEFFKWYLNGNISPHSYCMVVKRFICKKKKKKVQKTREK